MSAVYGEHLTEEELAAYLDEISNEEIIPEEDLPDASFPEYTNATNLFYEDGIIDASIASGIPDKIDKLNRFHAKLDKSNDNIQTVVTTITTPPVTFTTDKLVIEVSRSMDSSYSCMLFKLYDENNELIEFTENDFEITGITGTLYDNPDYPLKTMLTNPYEELLNATLYNETISGYVYNAYALISTNFAKFSIDFNSSVTIGRIEFYQLRRDPIGSIRMSTGNGSFITDAIFVDQNTDYTFNSFNELLPYTPGTTEEIIEDTILGNGEISTIDAVILLKNTMSNDITLDSEYNGVCVGLDTTGYNLKIEEGASLAAL